MAKSVSEVMGGILCCMEDHYNDHWCDDCPYEHDFNCKNVLHNDISYWAKMGKLELGKDGVWQPVGCNSLPKQKSKRKNGRRYSDGERRNNRHYEEE